MQIFFLINKSTFSIQILANSLVNGMRLLWATQSIYGIGAHIENGLKIPNLRYIEFFIVVIYNSTTCSIKDLVTLTQPNYVLFT
jgi:hypothetical protein